MATSAIMEEQQIGQTGIIPSNLRERFHYGAHLGFGDAGRYTSGCFLISSKKKPTPKNPKTLEWEHLLIRVYCTYYQTCVDHIHQHVKSFMSSDRASSRVMKPSSIFSSQRREVDDEINWWFVNMHPDPQSRRTSLERAPQPPTRTARLLLYVARASARPNLGPFSLFPHRQHLLTLFTLY